ncbi:GAF domain-containing protein [Streptomyces sp. B3I7]|uniref:helix-turn-helix domain-containing protein n=1 Tax=Streptomyces sp. B3I7 TaxID=3042269 RepID=UPI0027892167|nr:helix-turn-helix domain-containing protein [Streptomyces sp. B3I7]MDQ0815367.1 GAF domain-containing protein [Streptomyces sp. B3I7]
MTRHTFLRLLAEGAPASAYADALRAALAAPGADADTLREEYRLALRLRDRYGAQHTPLTSRRARPASERDLLTSATELTGATGDTDTVLTSVVARARRLLDCDLAYLSLNDPARPETHVRVMAGATTGDWKGVRIPFGTGIGGRVAESAVPLATPDYFHDRRLDHDAAVDNSARAERQRAILGVPLVHRGHVTGVLYASNRTAGPFAAQAVLRLASFAAPAAAAIARARLLDDGERALREARAAHTALQARARATARELAAHDHGTELVLRGGGLRELLDGARDFLGGCLAVVDGSRTPPAWTDGTPEDRLHTMVRAAGRTPEGTRGSTRADGCWVTALHTGDDSLGALVWAPDTPTGDATDADLRLLQRTAATAALLRLFARELAAAESRAGGDLLDALLDGSDRARAALAERARRLGRRPREPHVVLVAHPAARRLPPLSAATAELAAARGGLATVRDGYAVLALPSTDPAPTGRQLAASLSLRLGTPVTVGAAGPVTDPADLPHAHGEALACARALLRLDRTGESATVPDLGYTGLLLGDTAAAGDFVDRTLGPLLRHDARRATELLTTLETYFATGRSPARSADRLHVHPNTVTQRLDRVRRLLDLDWSDPDRTLDLQLALRLHRILRPATPGDAGPSAPGDADRPVPRDAGPSGPVNRR